MTAILEGVYKQGKIELLQVPADLPEGRVRVILIPQEDGPKPPRRLITFGMYQGDTSTLEDVRDAQWHGEKEWGDENAQ